MMGTKTRKPSQPSQLISAAWPLQRWGKDLVGPLPTTQGNYKYAIMALEYFTKWIEAKAPSRVTSEDTGYPRNSQLTMGNSLTLVCSKNFVIASERRSCLHPFITPNPTTQLTKPTG